MLIELKNVIKRYGSFALSCSLRLEEGRVTGLIGQNGAGKTTTFKTILGLVNPDSGEIRVFGRSRSQSGAEEREHIGAVLSDSGFGGHLTVKQAASILKSAYKSFREEEFFKRCAEYGLPADKKIREFSTGMKAKLKVLSALSHDSRLLILDEPTAGLDVVARDEILDMLRTYMETEGRGILISSHISGDLENLCDDVYMIHKGKLIFHEDTDVILSEYGLLKMEESAYANLDKDYILCARKENYGYCCLTKERQYYQENYPSVVAERCGLDQVQIMLTGGMGNEGII